MLGAISDCLIAPIVRIAQTALNHAAVGALPFVPVVRIPQTAMNYAAVDTFLTVCLH